MKNGTIVKLISILSILLMSSDHLIAQKFTVEPLFFMPEETRETSGLIFLNDKVITLNDSGNDPKLYEIDPQTGELERDLVVANATNGDWEDLTFDKQFIYIADIGNNKGNRLNLKIYRIPLLDYFQRTDGNLFADSINFVYQDQNNFEPTQFTNFDAGALITYEDSLYIFTKNWADLHTNIYSVPKSPGSYEARKVGRINTKGLVAGAVYNQTANEIMLVGYDLNNPFIVRLSEFEPYQFDKAKIDILPFELNGSHQVEAIEAISDTDYFITVEASDQGDALLLRLVTDFVVGLNDIPGENPVLYPNPTTGRINIKIENQQTPKSVSVFNTMGKHMYSRSTGSDFHSNLIQLDLGHLPQGFYQLKINSGNSEILRKLLISKSH
jgi:hypothetical protein